MILQIRSSIAFGALWLKAVRGAFKFEDQRTIAASPQGRRGQYSSALAGIHQSA